MSDPIAPHSGPISAYMSVHEATNLAYVKYFGQVEAATKATFQSINSHHFVLSYELPNDSQVYQLTVPFPIPLKSRDQIRPVLESMAKEAEEALGLPSSLSGPPPIKAIAKAMAASADIYTPPEPQVPLDSFYLPSLGVMVTTGIALSSLGVLTFCSDGYLKRQFPSQVVALRNHLGIHWLMAVCRWSAMVNAGGAAYTLITCMRRGWYSPLNTVRWTLSSIVWGPFSIGLLNKHARDVIYGKQ